MNIYIFITLVCAVFGGVAQLLFKSSTSQGLNLFSWKLLLGLFFYGLAFIGYLFALSKYNKLSVLYFVIAFSYVIVALGSFFIFKESFTFKMVLGQILVFIGILLITV